MSDVKELLRTALGDDRPPTDSLERTMGRSAPRRTRRRVVAGALGLVLTAALSVGLVLVATGGRPAPAVHPTPSVTTIGLANPLRVGGKIPAIAFHDGSAWVLTCSSRCGSEQGIHALERWDLATGHKTAVLPVGAYSQLAAGEGAVWAIDFTAGTVSRIDPATNRVSATIHLELPFAVCTNCPDARAFLPIGIAVGEGRVWVDTDRGAVAEIDPATNKVVRYFRLPGEAPSGIAAGLGAVWIAGGTEGLFRIDATTGHIDRLYPIGRHADAGPAVAPQSVIVTPTEVWVAGSTVHLTGFPADPWASSGGSEVVGIDPATFSIDSILAMPWDSATVIGATSQAVIGVVAGSTVFWLDPTTGRHWIGGGISAHGDPLAVYAGEVWSADTRGNLWRTSVSPSPGPTPSNPAPFLLSCSDSVYGQLGNGWQRDSVVVGPIAFAGLRAAAVEPHKSFAHHRGGWGGTKTIVVVSEGKAVTVSIPPSERGRLALLYDSSAFKLSGGWYSPSEGEQAVTFRACEPGQSPYRAFGAKGATQFAGGFIVAGAQCASLDVTAAGEPTKHVRIPFGKDTCP
jgi:streptogramin lyase